MSGVFRVPGYGREARSAERTWRVCLILVCALVLLAPTACSGAPESATIMVDTPAPQATAMPSIVPTVTVTAAPTVVLDRTPTSGKGNVIGLMIRAPRGVAPYPMADTKLYLAEMLRNASGELAGLAGVDEERAPSTVTDSKGQFAFTDIEPGHYASGH